MPDLILGQPTNLTTVTDNGAGFCRVTFAPWELDWEFYLGILTTGVHYIANTTVGNSSAITAKGGAEHLGYWFDTDRAFPGGWATGNRCTPQRQAAILQHATLAAAMAAGANYDWFLMWYSNAINCRAWFDAARMIGKYFNMWGMLSRKQVKLISATLTTYGIRAEGNLLAQAVQLQWINLAVIGYTSVTISYSPTAGQAGAGVLVRRCYGSGGLYVFAAANHTAGTVEWQNCDSHGGQIGFYAGIARNCSAVYQRYGFFNSEDPLRNLVAAACAGSCYSGGALAGAQYCADTDGTLPVHATNLLNQDMRTNFRFFFDLARPGDKAFAWDSRIHQDSVLTGAGLAIPAVVYDADGQLRPDPPSIGAYEPYSTCYAPGAEIVRGARRRGAGA